MRDIITPVLHSTDKGFCQTNTTDMYRTFQKIECSEISVMDIGRTFKKTGFS